METIKINAKVSCNNDKSNLTITLYLSEEDKQRLLVESLHGKDQPKGMFRVVVKDKGGKQ